MTDTTFRSILEEYAPATENRAVTVALRDAEMACKPKGLVSVIVAFFGG